MVRIRLRRVGARNQPSYRIVAADKESPRDGRFLEAIGFYNPRTEPSTIQIDEARLFHWMNHGAQPSDSVVQALRSVGTWDRWERFKSGEEIEVLLKEAEAAIPVVDPRTRRDDLFETRQKKKKKSPKEPQAEAEDVEVKDEESVDAAEQVDAPEEEVSEAESPAEEAEVAEVEAPSAEGSVEVDAPAEDEEVSEEPEDEQSEAETSEESDSNEEESIDPA